MRVRDLKQSTTIAVRPEVVYEALMDSEKHAAFTGFDATIFFEEGGIFETCGGRNFGYTLVLVPAKKIVQAWRHRDWPKHHYSIAVFDLGTARGSTKLSFSQSGIPESALDWIQAGWRSIYWKPLKAYLEKGVVPERKV